MRALLFVILGQLACGSVTPSDPRDAGAGDVGAGLVDQQLPDAAGDVAGELRPCVRPVEAAYACGDDYQPIGGHACLTCLDRGGANVAGAGPCTVAAPVAGACVSSCNDCPVRR